MSFCLSMNFSGGHSAPRSSGASAWAGPRSALDHPNIVKLYEVFVDAKKVSKTQKEKDFKGFQRFSFDFIDFIIDFIIFLLYLFLSSLELSSSWSMKRSTW